MKRILIVLAGLAIVALAVPLLAVGSLNRHAAKAARADVTVTDLGTLGGRTSFAAAINDKGVVTGGADLEGGTQHAFRWSDGDMVDLGTLPGGSSSSGADINARGDVVGTSVTPQGPFGRATLWRNGDAAVDLGTFGGTIGNATGINDRGVVVGIAGIPGDAEPRAFVWDGGPLEGVGDLGPSSRASAINKHGVIVGTAVVAASGGGMADHAFASAGGSVTDLGSTLAGDPAGASDVNDHGVIVGSDLGVSEDGWVYRNGEMVDLGFRGNPSAINNHGTIVGTFCIDLPLCDTVHAFVVRDGARVDLNSLLPAGSGWVLRTAADVNDHGVVVGRGVHDGVDRAYLLTLPKK